MEKIRREIKLFWIRNGKPLLKFVGIIIGIIFIIQLLNEYAKVQNETEEEERVQKIEDHQKGQIEKQKIEENKKIISTFLDYCQNNEIINAYEMLSDKCKEEKYVNIEEFKTKYVSRVFYQKLYYQIEEQNTIYKINFKKDILQTGKIESENIIEDYYKIEEDILENKTIYINFYNSI